MNTEDIPYLGSLSRKSHDTAASGSKATGGVGGPVALFDPVVVELNATILLRFLQVLQPFRRLPSLVQFFGRT